VNDCGYPECPVPEPHVHRSDPVDTHGLDDLFVWWMEQAAEEARKLSPKAKEYGSYDLELMGQALGEMTGQDSTVAHNMEQAIVFYLLGKIARAVSAVRSGHGASDDTFIDIAIYARMVLYIREHGRWP
jgi:hypothetical protein